MHVGVSVQTDDLPLCYSFNLLELPANLRHYFKDKATAKGVVRISFASPTPKHYMYIGRNHTFVEDLSRAVVNDSVNGGELGACRALVMETSEIGKRTTILLMRVRSVIRDKRWKPRIGWRGNDIRRLSWKIDNHDFLTQEEAKQLFLHAQASGSMDLPTQKTLLTNSIRWITDEKTLRQHTDDIALERASHLVDAFSKYRTYLKASEYQVVEPVLPMDVIAAYLFVPKL